MKLGPIGGGQLGWNLRRAESCGEGSKLNPRSPYLGLGFWVLRSRNSDMPDEVLGSQQQLQWGVLGFRGLGVWAFGSLGV